MVCTHDARRYLRFAPVPCQQCQGWVDKDGSVIDASTAIARYPAHEGTIRAAQVAGGAGAAPQREVQREMIACMVCQKTGRNSRGGPCSNCQGRGYNDLSTNRVWRAAQLTGHTVGTFFLLVKALAAIVIVIIVVYLILSTVL